MLLPQLKFMRNRLNLPVVYDATHKGYRDEIERCLPSEKAAIRALFGGVLQALSDEFRMMSRVRRG